MVLASEADTTWSLRNLDTNKSVTALGGHRADRQRLAYIFRPACASLRELACLFCDVGRLRHPALACLAVDKSG